MMDNTKEITLEIKDFFDFISQKFEIKFKENEFVDLDELGIEVQIPNADGKYVDINGLIIKKDDLYETSFDNGKTLKSAAGHLISVEPFHKPDECLTRFTKDWEPGDDIPYLKTKCVSNKKIAEGQTVYGLSVVDDKHLYKDSDGMIHHNTYTVRKIIEQYIGDSGKKLVYSAGAMSPAITSVAPFFFFHKDNEIIILDDNDKILMKSCDQNTQNFMKAVLDPSAMRKPVTLAPKYVKMSQSNLDDYAAQSLDESVGNRGTRVDIDMEALKEGFFRYSINGEVKDCFKLSEADKLAFSNMISSKKLKEAFDDEDDESLFGDDNDDEFEGDGQSNITMEPSFIFNSSVVFISNLKLKDISSAVADRCECIEVSLTLPQFMERLEAVLGGLCKGEEYSSRPQWMRDWGKQSAYTAFLGVVEAFNSGATLFGHKVTIRRKFTFRLFEEMANEWCRLASAYALRHNDLHLNIEDKEDQRKIAQAITGKFLLSFMSKLNQKG